MNKMKRFQSLLWGVIVGLPISLFAQEAYVNEKNVTMETYGFSDPDPVAHPGNLIYPYFRYDGFETEKKDKEWKTVEMENPYIKVTLFPEIGGKIWGAIDKTIGKEFLYYNHVVKFRDIAMRGAWVSGGVEFNFGIIGHVPTSATPVDYMIKEKQDGSVSCYISSIELLTRTYWTVEVNLPKDKAYFTTHTTWYNASSLDQPYYHWMNAAYHASSEMEFCYPGNYYIGHGGDLHSFPVDSKGHKLNWYKENAFESSKSYHVLGYYNDFYGTYWHDQDFGSVHYSPYDEKLGMKIFLWSQARDGAIWEDLLTDTDGQYVELQSGKMYNQPATGSARTTFKHAFFRPEALDDWTEYWYPVRETGGIVKASPIGALNVIREGAEVILRFSPLQDMSAKVCVESDGKNVFEEVVSFKTLEVWNHSIPSIPSNCKLKVIIGDRELVYSEDEKDNEINRPKEIPKDFDWNSAYGLYVSGEQWLYQKYNLNAERDLKASLEKEPYFSPALVRLASLYYRWGRYNAALELVKTALSLNAYDGEANYIYGLCNSRLGYYTDAKDGFSVAAYDPAIRSAAYANLAGLFIREKNWKQALVFAEKSLEMNPNNLHALQEQMICYRYLGDKEKALALQNRVLENLPLLQTVRYEQYRLQPSEASRQTFVSMIRNELPKETYMELAVWYEAIGCLDEAIELLSFANEDPMSIYKRAYLLHLQRKEDAAQELIKKAETVSMFLVFPFRAENLSAIQWVCTQTSSWRPIYLQALLWHANGDVQKAKDLLKTCPDTDFNPFYLYRASLQAGNDRLADLKRAETLDKNWRTGLALIRYYSAQNEWKLANETAARYYKMYPDNYVIGLQYGTTLCQVREYRKSVALLKKIQVLPTEGAYIGRAIYRKANLYEAIEYMGKGNFDKAIRCIESSKDWIENLGVGKPYDSEIDYRLEDYLEAQALPKSNPKRTQLLEKVATSKTSKQHFQSAYLLAAMAMKELGQAESDQLVDQWTSSFPDNPMAQWCVAVYKGEKEKAARLLDTRTEVNASTPWENVYIDHNFDLLVKLFE